MSPPAPSEPFAPDEDRDHAVTVWRTPDGCCYARSGEVEAFGSSIPYAVKHLFQMLYPEAS